MATNESNIEHRLTTLENDVAALKNKLNGTFTEKGSANWVADVAGSMRHVSDDDFEEFLKCCNEVREVDGET